MAGLQARELVILGAALAAGLAGTAVALGGRGADSAFLHRQENPVRVRAAEVERVVRTAPDPATGTGEGLRAMCRPRGSGTLRNPWSCTVSYSAGRRVRLTVRIRDDGRYVGRYAGGGIAEGCCIKVPGAD